MMAQAQILNVTAIEPLNIQQDENKVVQAVAISPQGDYLLLSTDTKRGLVKWDLATGLSSTLTDDEGAGSDVRIGDGGSVILYSEVSYKDKRRHQAVKSIDLTTGKRQTLVKPSRNGLGFSIDGGVATTVAGGKVSRHVIRKGESPSHVRPVLSRHHLNLYITRDGETTMLAPNGADEHYIWASLSPDGGRVLYYVSGHGAFVCDVDGSNVIFLGNLTAPKWWDDNTVVGMNEVDGEYSITASAIVIRTLDGREQVLTGDDVIATYPLPSPQSGKIVFSTPDGSIYMITVDD